MSYLEWLKRKIKANDLSNKEFLISDASTSVFSDLLIEIKNWGKLLQEKNIKIGQVVAFKGDFSLEVAGLFLALIENKNIILPISSTAEDKVKYYLEVASVQHLFDFDRSFKMKYHTLHYESQNSLIKNIQRVNEPGLILFTSGSTGKPKGALHSLKKILNRYTLDSKKTFKTLLFLRLDHIGGINTFFSMLSNGATIVSDNNRTTKSICEAIQKYRVELFPTTPSFLNLILISETYKEYDLSSLQLITYGTEVMGESLLNKLVKAFTKVRFKQTYGMTETGILSSKSENSKSVWVKLGGDGYQVKVVDGILWVKSETSILGYLNAPSPFNKDGWLVTNDRVDVKGDYFRFLGRQEEIINVGGLKVYPTEVEDTLMQIDNIKDVAVYGEKNTILGNIVCANVTLKRRENISTLRKRIYKCSEKRLERYKIPQKITISEKLHNDRFKKQRIPSL